MQVTFKPSKQHPVYRFWDRTFKDSEGKAVGKTYEFLKPGEYEVPDEVGNILLGKFGLFAGKPVEVKAQAAPTHNR